MKPYIFLLLSVFIFLSSFAQTGGLESLAVRVEKKAQRYNKPVTVSLQFKPGSFLKVKTSEGKNLMSRNYIIQDSSIVMYGLAKYSKEYTDTIPFQDIVKIRGKVYGNIERKVGGAMLALTGIPLLGFTYVAAALSVNSMGTAFMMLPVFSVPATGMSFMGARTFDTGKKWDLKSTPSGSFKVNNAKKAGK